MISKIPNPMDILAAFGKTASGETQKSDNNPVDAFQKLLDKVIKGIESTPPAKAQGQESAQTQEPETVDDATAEAAVAAAAQPAQQQSQDTSAETPDSAAATAATTPQATVQPLVLIPPTQARQTAPAAGTETPMGQQSQTGDILSVQVTALPPETPEAQTTTQAQVQQQDRFGEMLDHAQQQLDSMTNQPPQNAAQNAQTQAPADPAVPETQLPAEDADVQPDIEQKQPESQQKPAAETPKTELPQTQIKEQPAKPVTEQKPLSELSENDRAVMQMKEAKPAPEREPAQAPEAASQPETPRAENTRQPEPQRPAQLRAQPEQIEQVRVEMAKNLEQGRTEFRMQLQPEELGKVDVKMILQGDRLAVEIMASTPKAAEMLQRQVDGLLQSLRMQQFEVQTISIVTETENASGQMGGAFNMLNGQAQEGGQNGAGRSGFGGGAGGEDAQQSDQTDAEQQRNPDALLDYAI